MTQRNLPVIEGKNRWLPAAVAALVINLMLLSVLPVVNLGKLKLPKNPPPLQAVKYVRLAPAEPEQPRPPEEPPQAVQRPEITSPQDPVPLDLTPESLERTLRPDLPAVALPTLPGPGDIPLADIDLKAMVPGDVFDADQLDRPLIPVSRVPPFYPIQARRAAIQGWVEVSFLVNVDGRVTDVRVIDAQPPGVFEDSVRQTVSRWRFQPGTIMGEPVKARVTTTIRFELEDNP